MYRYNERKTALRAAKEMCTEICNNGNYALKVGTSRYVDKNGNEVLAARIEYNTMDLDGKVLSYRSKNCAHLIRQKLGAALSGREKYLKNLPRLREGFNRSDGAWVELTVIIRDDEQALLTFLQNIRVCKCMRYEGVSLEGQDVCHICQTHRDGLEHCASCDGCIIQKSAWGCENEHMIHDECFDDLKPRTCRVCLAVGFKVHGGVNNSVDICSLRSE